MNISCWLVLEYCCWYTANILNISVFDALSTGSGHVAAVGLCVKREEIVEECGDCASDCDLCWACAVISD